MTKPDEQDERELEGVAKAISDAVTRQFGEPVESAMQKAADKMQLPEVPELPEVEPEAEDVDVD